MDKQSQLEMFKREEQLMNNYLKEINEDHLNQVNGIEEDRVTLHKLLADFKSGLNDNA
jgi:hypothetical protein